MLPHNKKVVIGCLSILYHLLYYDYSPWTIRLILLFYFFFKNGLISTFISIVFILAYIYIKIAFFFKNYALKPLKMLISIFDYLSILIYSKVVSLLVLNMFIASPTECSYNEIYLSFLSNVIMLYSLL